MSNISRRRFLQTTAAGSALLLSGTRASGNILGANDRVRIAVAGLNGRGKDHLGGWLGLENVEVAYIIDPDDNVRNSTIKMIEKKTGKPFTGKAIKDVRNALEDKNLDALSVATPNHWHSLMTIWGAQAGKHVYVEKPMSHDVAEGRIAVEAQKNMALLFSTEHKEEVMPTLQESLKQSRLVSSAD